MGSVFAQINVGSELIFCTMRHPSTVATAPSVEPIYWEQGFKSHRTAVDTRKPKVVSYLGL